MWSPQLLLLVRFQRKLPWMPSVSALFHVLLPVFLLVLLHLLQVPLLCPPLRTLTIAGITATTEIKLNFALSPCLLGSRKLTDQQEIHALPAGDFNLMFLLNYLSRYRFLVGNRVSVSMFPQATATISASASLTHVLTAGGHLFLALGPVPFLSSLVRDVSPGPFSWLQSPSPSLALIFSNTMLS